MESSLWEIPSVAKSPFASAAVIRQWLLSNGGIEADSCEDALEQYLDIITDNLRAVDAVYSGKCGDIVEYQYDNVILEITMKEIEEDA